MINNRRKAKTVASYDFTTLYTSIPHSKLLESLKFVCHDAYKCSKKLFLVANKNRAYWSDKSVNSKKSISFTADLLLQWITFLVNNSYVTFGSRVYRQVIGIPMGTDCAPVVANIFLFYYELKFVSSLSEEELNDKYNFTEFTSRYLDDIIIFNDNGEFANIFSEIYPSEMELVPTHSSDDHVNFLDLNISVKDGLFISSLFDKRTEFKFKVRSMPHFYSNAPNSSAIGTFISQLTRYLEINSDFSLFTRDCKLLRTKLIYQGFPANYLNDGIKRFIKNKSLNIINKYWTLPKLRDFIS